MTIVLALGLLFVVGFLVTHGSSYSSPQISAVVTDGFTSKPVADAMVEVSWGALKPRGWHGSDSMTVHSVKVVTDANGRFTVPAWGPVSVDRGWEVYEWEPQVLVTKPGYDYVHEGNCDSQEPVTSGFHLTTIVLKSPSWEEQDIQLWPTNPPSPAALRPVPKAPPAGILCYILYRKPVESSRFIDTPDFPKEGYIRPQPDVILTTVLSLHTNSNESHLYNQETSYEQESKSGITLTISPADAKALVLLQRRCARTHSILLMLGDEPLDDIIMTMYADPPSAYQIPTTPYTYNIPIRAHHNLTSIVEKLGKMTGQPH